MHRCGSSHSSWSFESQLDHFTTVSITLWWFNWHWKHPSTPWLHPQSYLLIQCIWEWTPLGLVKESALASKSRSCRKVLMALPLAESISPTSSSLASLDCYLFSDRACFSVCSNGRCSFTSNTLVSAVQTGFRKLDWNTGMA